MLRKDKPRLPVQQLLILCKPACRSINTILVYGLIGTPSNMPFRGTWYRTLLAPWPETWPVQQLKYGTNHSVRQWL